MARNRVRELMNQRGWSRAELARRSGLDPSYISRILSDERGKRALSEYVEEKLSAAFGVTVEELTFGPMAPQATKQGAPTGFYEEAAPFEISDDDGRNTPGQPLNIVYFQVKLNHLDGIGILGGDILKFDLSADAVSRVQPLDIVVAQVYDPHELTKGHTIIRQFIPPAILSTNSVKHNLPPINLDFADAHIKGVAVRLIRNLK